MLVLESLVGLHRTVQLQILQHYWSGHRLDYCDIEWFALETNRDHSVVFEIAPNTSFWTLVDYDGYSISSKRVLPSTIDMVYYKMLFSPCYYILNYVYHIY